MSGEILFEELILGNAQGGRKPSRDLQIEVVGSLTPEDLERMLDDVPMTPAQTILQIRHSHHQLARLLALGTEQNEVSLITGYAPAYISTIKKDPTFQELLTYYAKQREAMFIDTLERMRSLGLSTIDELQARLADEPEKWSKRELMDLAGLMLVDSGVVGSKGGGNSSPAASQPNINISFVTANPQPLKVIDLEEED